jgi:hypothetical protein
MGENPLGSVIFSLDGWLSAQLASSDRPQLTASDPRLATEPELAAAFRSYVSYAGPYEFSPEKLVTKVKVSLNPNWVGGEQTRFWAMEGNTLVLRTPPFAAMGTTVELELRWERL